MSLKKINEICQKESSNLRQKDIEGQDGAYPVYGASGLISKVDFYQQEKEYIAIVKDGSGIGRVTFLPPKSSVIGTMQYILPTNGYDIKYVCYCLQSLDLSKYKQGAAIPHIYFRDYGECLVNVADDLEEQTRIVEKLDAAFEKIDRLKKNAEEGLQAVKDLWEATLREEMKPKEGWKKKSLSEICLKITDGSHNPPKGLDHSEYLMLSSKNVRNDRFSFENPRYLSKFDFENEDKRTKVEKGDVFLTIVGAGLGDCCVYNHSDKITLQRSVCVLKPNKATSSRFLMYLLQSSYERIHKESNGAAQKGIYLNQLSQFLVEMPNIEEQRRVEISLDKISTICQTLQRKYEQELSEYEALKQSILRKAFSGEL